MDQEVFRLRRRFPAVLCRLPGGHLWTEHDVTEQPKRWFLVLGGFPQLVHRETHHVGRAGQIHETLVILGMVASSTRRIDRSA